MRRIVVIRKIRQESRVMLVRMERRNCRRRVDSPWSRPRGGRWLLRCHPTERGCGEFLSYLGKHRPKRTTRVGYHHTQDSQVDQSCAGRLRSCRGERQISYRRKAMTSHENEHAKTRTRVAPPRNKRRKTHSEWMRAKTKAALSAWLRGFRESIDLSTIWESKTAVLWTGICYPRCACAL